MWSYAPPLAHMRFVIDEVLAAPASWSELPAHDGLDADTAAQVLEEAGRFASEVLAPINGAADLEGCRWRPEDGAVTTPAGYRAAYRAFVDGGWPALACAAEDGGQGLPQLLNAALYEMLAAANHAWTMYPGLLHGAYECLKAHGSDELKARWLPQIASGDWLATMALTEPQAGSDLGRVATRGEPQADGSLRVSGGKIFISGGEHDLTDNIVHLVLLRLAGAPAGSRGLSLALVPKLLPDGSRNAVRCDGIEKKMGIKGSATCVLAFEGATGWLVGEPGRGLAAMFVMMNAARLHVGLQGLGHLEMATQNAIAYAHERLQMRAAAAAPREAGRASDGADPIALHPSVRRTLWKLRALAEGARVVAYRTAMALDSAEHHPDAAMRQQAQALAGLLTPVVKAFLSHWGFHGAAAAQQVWGGYGYVHEYGIEQTVRDSRIAMIYEGTNEIQAIDLVQRRLHGADGASAWSLLRAELHDEAVRCAAVPALAGFARALRAQSAAADDAVGAVVAGRPGDTDWPLAVADDLLHGLGCLLLGWAWARSARAALAHAGEPWFDERLAAAQYGIDWLLPDAAPHWQRVMARGAALPAAPAAA